jgi:membrane-associated phospholipid phosphatase
MTVALVYFGYLACLAAFRRSAPKRRRIQVFAVAVFVMVSIKVAGGGHVLPLVYLLAGYWLPGLLVTQPDVRLGDRLLAFDYRLFGPRGLATFVARAPRAIVGYLELAYLLCYAVIPAGWVWLVVSGHEQIDRFWTTVLLASFLCYGLLPWLPSSAPRAVEAPPPGEPSIIRKLNVNVLDRASVQWNTFPSGHTAASFAVALAVGIDPPAAGLIFALIAISIAIGSVVGRYHYAADALAGVLVALASWAMTSAVHAP